MPELTFDIDEAQFDQLVGLIARLNYNELEALSARIRPVVRRDGCLYHVEQDIPHWTVYTMGPLSTRPVENLVNVAEIHTLHKQGWHRLPFKPSMEEVYTLMPASLQGTVIAFETVGPQTVEDIDCQLPASNAGWHVGITILYAAA